MQMLEPVVKMFVRENMPRASARSNNALEMKTTTGEAYKPGNDVVNTNKASTSDALAK